MQLRLRTVCSTSFTLSLSTYIIVAQEDCSYWWTISDALHVPAYAFLSLPMTSCRRNQELEKENLAMKMRENNLLMHYVALKDWLLVCCCCCCWLPDPFRGIGAWRKTMEPQKPSNSPGSGPEVVHRQRVAKE